MPLSREIKAELGSIRADVPSSPEIKAELGSK